jgi:hypothetical protein
MAGYVHLKIYYAGPGLQVNQGFLDLFIGFQGYIKVHAGDRADVVWLIINGNSW